MPTFTGTDAKLAVVAFFGAHSASLPDHTREKLTEAIATNDLLGTIIPAMEALYAARSELNAEGVELLYDLAFFVSANNFYGKAVRAGQISGVADRIAAGGAAIESDDIETEPGFEAPEAAGEPATDLPEDPATDVAG